ncbi:hypothetical protein HN873_016866, partial [Arachis hypogaea]
VAGYILCFDFTIEHIKVELNSLPDFLTREFLQEKNGSKTASNEDYGQPFDQIKERKLPIIPVPAKPLSLRPMTMSQVVKAASSSSPSKSSLITTNIKFILLQPSDLYSTQPLKEQFSYYEKIKPQQNISLEKR